jgi:hypothetical protein
VIIRVVPLILYRLVRKKYVAEVTPRHMSLFLILHDDILDLVDLPRTKFTCEEQQGKGCLEA